VKIKLRASVNRVDTNFTALLVDYGKDERVDHDSSGEGITAVEGESCHGESTEKEDACYGKVQKTTHVAPYEIVSRGWLDARHRKSLRTSTPLVPDQPYNFGWRIFGEDYVFKKGHRIGIVISASDGDYTVPDPEGATTTVFLRRTRIILPLTRTPRTFR
jgi:X-Pro dipeptidyl-peptidase